MSDKAQINPIKPTPCPTQEEQRSLDILFGMLWGVMEDLMIEEAEPDRSTDEEGQPGSH